MAVVDFAKIKYLTLHDPAPGAALVLRQTPIAMLFAVLETLVTLEKKRWLSHLAVQITKSRIWVKEGRSVTNAFGDPKTAIFLGFPQIPALKIVENRFQLRKSG